MSQISKIQKQIKEKLENSQEIAGEEYKKENQKKEEIRNIRSRKGRTYGEKTCGKGVGIGQIHNTLVVPEEQPGNSW